MQTALQDELTKVVRRQDFRCDSPLYMFLSFSFAVQVKSLRLANAGLVLQDSCAMVLVKGLVENQGVCHIKLPSSPASSSSGVAGASVWVFSCHDSCHGSCHDS